jgi:hypothetical protein
LLREKPQQLEQLLELLLQLREQVVVHMDYQLRGEVEHQHDNTTKAAARLLLQAYPQERYNLDWRRQGKANFQVYREQAVRLPKEMGHAASSLWFAYTSLLTGSSVRPSGSSRSPSPAASPASSTSSKVVLLVGSSCLLLDARRQALQQLPQRQGWGVPKPPRCVMVVGRKDLVPWLRVGRDFSSSLESRVFVPHMLVTEPRALFDVYAAVELEED